MVKAPTMKSRAAAFVGLLFIEGAYVVDGWLTPAVPSFVADACVAACIAMMFVARGIREREGPEFRIPDVFRKQIRRLTNTELVAALAAGSSGMIALWTKHAGEPEVTRQIAFSGAMGLIPVALLVGYATNRKYRSLIATYDRERSQRRCS